MVGKSTSRPFIRAAKSNIYTSLPLKGEAASAPGVITTLMVTPMYSYWIKEQHVDIKFSIALAYVMSY